MELVLLTFLIIIVVTGEIILRIYKKSTSHSLLRVFVVMTLLYAAPASIDSYLNLVRYEKIKFLLFYNISALAFLYIGYLSSVKTTRLRVDRDLGYFNIKLLNLATAYIGLMIPLVALIYCLATYHAIGSIENLFSAYLSAENHTENNFAEKIRLWSMGGLSGLLVMYVLIRTKKNKFVLLLNIAVFLSVVAVLVLMLVRGNRSGILLVIMAPLMYLLSVERWGLLKFFGVAISILIVGQLIDYIRAVGFENALTADIYQPLSIGEFGQTARGFDLYFSAYEPFNYRFGTTYVWDVFHNIATTLGSEFRPLSTRLSEIGSGSGQMIGFGFSHQLESYINFGYLGPVIYFFIGILLSYLNGFIASDSLILRSVYYLIFPYVLIAQRIDFPVLVKMAAIPLIILLIARIMLPKSFVAKLKIPSKVIGGLR